jgi:hypothetical protein
MPVPQGVRRQLWGPASQGLMLGFACSVPDCWLEVSLHPESPATDQLDQGFPWFSMVPEQMLSWYPNSTLIWVLHLQPSQW